MAVSFDAIGTGVDSITGQSSPFTLTTLTVGTGNQRALVVQIAWLAAAPAGLTVNWDSAGTPQACTLIKSQAGVNGQTVQLWGLLAPTSGNKTLSVAWSAGTTELMLQAAAWTGVDQTSTAVAFPNSTSATGNNATATVNVTSAINNATMACCVAGSLQAISSVNNTQTFLLHGHGNLEAGGNRAAGAASVTMSGTFAGTDQWAIVATDILAAAAGGNVPGLTHRPFPFKPSGAPNPIGRW